MAVGIYERLPGVNAPLTSGLVNMIDQNLKSKTYTGRAFATFEGVFASIPPLFDITLNLATAGVKVVLIPTPILFAQKSEITKEVGQRFSAVARHVYIAVRAFFMSAIGTVFPVVALFQPKAVVYLADNLSLRPPKEPPAPPVVEDESVDDSEGEGSSTISNKASLEDDELGRSDPPIIHVDGDDKGEKSTTLSRSTSPVTFEYEEQQPATPPAAPLLEERRPETLSYSGDSEGGTGSTASSRSAPFAPFEHEEQQPATPPVAPMLEEERSEALSYSGDSEGESGSTISSRAASLAPSEHEDLEPAAPPVVPVVEEERADEASHSGDSEDGTGSTTSSRAASPALSEHEDLEPAAPPVVPVVEEKRADEASHSGDSEDGTGSTTSSRAASPALSEHEDPQPAAPPVVPVVEEERADEASDSGDSEDGTGSTTSSRATSPALSEHEDPEPAAPPVASVVEKERAGDLSHSGESDSGRSTGSNSPPPLLPIGEKAQVPTLPPVSPVQEKEPPRRSADQLLKRVPSSPRLLIPILLPETNEHVKGPLDSHLRDLATANRHLPSEDKHRSLVEKLKAKTLNHHTDDLDSLHNTLITLGSFLQGRLYSGDVHVPLEDHERQRCAQVVGVVLKQLIDRGLATLSEEGRITTEISNSREAILATLEEITYPDDMPNLKDNADLRDDVIYTVTLYYLGFSYANSKGALQIRT